MHKRPKPHSLIITIFLVVFTLALATLPAETAQARADYTSAASAGEGDPGDGLDSIGGSGGAPSPDNSTGRAVLHPRTGPVVFSPGIFFPPSCDTRELPDPGQVNWIFTPALERGGAK